MRDRIRRLVNAGFDRAYGVSTLEFGLTEMGRNSALGDPQKYVPVDYLALFYLFAPLPFGPSEVFVDIGCGLGRAVLMAARRPVRRAIGIEYDADLARLARENTARVRGAQAPMEIRHQDASRAAYEDGTIFWMYHPFGERTMAQVLDRLRQSLAASPRRALIAYVNPELAALLDAQPWLRRWGERRFPGAGESGRAIYWQAEGPVAGQSGATGA